MTLDLTSILEEEKKGYDHLSIIDRAAKLEKKLEEGEEEVLERGKNYKIVRIKGEAPHLIIMQNRFTYSKPINLFISLSQEDHRFLIGG